MARTHRSTRFRDLLLTAKMHARLAAAVYCGRDAVRDLASLCGGQDRFYETGYIRAAVLSFRDHAHITVCGSNDLHDWVQNLSARQHINVHAGFLNSALQLQKAFSASDLGRFLENRPVIIGGHSAGGAIANLLAECFGPQCVVTFGAPRVFSHQRSVVYASERWEEFRFVMPGDYVPHLPLRSFRKLYGGAKYAHSAGAIELRDDGTVGMERSPWKAVWENIIHGWLTIGGMRQSPQRHSIDRYKQAIFAACEKEQLR
ncbi:lipase family protein [Roseimaritima ulvae]|uniref:Lipase (Class 3) n=1 Tax=Roseimaritima ulvae TaxID=980254 RepID=A0A5B9QN70_9BACT|nr:lipase family protein [Roseimaritima ulvae]QEG40404.1 Lipase (class 3) [Roseimaritima ulvae]